MEITFEKTAEIYRIADQGKKDLALESNFHTEQLHKLICNDVGISLKGAALQFYQRNIVSYLTTGYVTRNDNKITIIETIAFVKCRVELRKKLLKNSKRRTCICGTP